MHPSGTDPAIPSSLLWPFHRFACRNKGNNATKFIMLVRKNESAMSLCSLGE